MYANALKLITDEQQQEVEKAVAEAEKRTSAEIVCAVATESGRYDRAESLVGLLFALGVLGIASLLARGAPDSPDSWTVDRGLAFHWQFLAVLGGFVAGSFVASYVHFLRRLFVLRRHMEVETDRSASKVFVERRLRSTRDAGGLLLYVSAFERRAVVLADDGVLSRVGQPFLDTLRDTAIANLKQGKRSEAFLETVSLATEKLAEVLPNQDTEDELPNNLLRFHPRP